MEKTIEKSKQELLIEIDKRLADKIIEPTNAALLKKLIGNADTLSEAIAIAELGTTYKMTGFHFDKRLEKMGDTIKFFKKNEKLSFATDENALTHKLIIGDNYDALQNLLIQYKGKIDVIYIDPPYGKDSMGEFAETNYENAITRDNLLSMLYPRLVLARQLLSDSGVIFCSIDDKNQAYVKGLFDEVFGEYYTDIAVWRKSGVGRDGKMKNTTTFRKDHEYIVVAFKDEKRLNKSHEKPDWENEYSNPDNDPRGGYKAGSISRKEEASNPNHSNYYSVTSPSGKTYTRQFEVSQADFMDLDKNNRIYWGINGDAVPAQKIFQNEKRYVTTSSLLAVLDYRNATTTIGSKELEEIVDCLENIGMEMRPKPIDLIAKLFQIASNESSTILDFFAGSGTTGQAVLELNKEDGGRRQFILVNNNEKTETTPNGIVQDVTSKRLKRVMSGKCYDGTDNFKWLEKNEPLGDNLDVYDIDEVANFASGENSTPFDVIDETLYGLQKLSVKDKIKWVCENFENTQHRLETDKDNKTNARGE